jgi:hypothetical protein
MSKQRLPRWPLSLVIVLVLAAPGKAGRDRVPPTAPKVFGPRVTSWS